MIEVFRLKKVKSLILSIFVTGSGNSEPASCRNAGERGQCEILLQHFWILVRWQKDDLNKRPINTKTRPKIFRARIRLQITLAWATTCVIYFKLMKTSAMLRSRLCDCVMCELYDVLINVIKLRDCFIFVIFIYFT